MNDCIDLHKGNKSEQIRRAVLEKIADHLKYHLFSEENIPDSVVIQTTYAECVQILRISFKEVEE